MHDVKWTYRFH